jgi:hypothetical protein
MAKRMTARSASQTTSPEEHLPGGKNPRNSPVHHQDATTPQPNAPAQRERRRQDQQPMHPEPLLEHVEEREGDKLQELRNG